MSRSELASFAADKPLSRSQARRAADVLVSGQADDEEITAFLGAIQSRGATADELTGFAETMRAKAIAVRVERPSLIDTCGTGGSGLGAFNFSTAAALVAAGAGAAVAKHGNRAASSRSGSADVLQALGVTIDLAPADVKASIERLGFGFFFAPRYHPAMKNVAALRKSIGAPTVFNLLGPLLNPAGVRRQVVGIYDRRLVETYAQTLANLGAQRAIVVHGADGLDEMSLAGDTLLCHVEMGKPLRTETVVPEEAGLQRVSPESLRGGDAIANARRIEDILDGAEGPLFDATLWNAAAALLVAGVAADLKEGVHLARESVVSGRAAAVLAELRRMGKEDGNA